MRPGDVVPIHRPSDREAARSHTRHQLLVSLIAAFAAQLGMFAVHQLPLGASGIADIATSPESFVYVGLFAGALTFALLRVLGSEIERLRDLSITDPLTGLYNRRHFEERIEAEVARARRHNLPLAVLMIDVDRLKQINDLGGHAAGDRILTRVGRAIALSVRSSDVAARLGGDEFAVFLPNVHGGDAAALAERIHAGIRGGRSDAAPVSIGIADLKLGVSGWRSLLFSADAALYEAKAMGGGQTVVARRRMTLELLVPPQDDLDDERARHG